ncbi:M48 family metallopeptidase [Brevundimonas albigilva]|uniref:M48 family metallopeptidase n=1 Tax=Brevundimonas albigilva TaxID=1312364 RepID=UPI00201B960E|nr:SprT family zinc-dependent metalloprotease [Brevundimonas albigilva]UQV19676.1 M48 family metallopeptidase [Brevundimonas albigilva]
MAYRDGQRLPLDERGGPGPVLRLSVNPRARRLSVRIDARAGEAVVIAPSERGLAQAVAFRAVQGRVDFRTSGGAPRGRPLQPGQVISLKGRPVRLEATPGAGAARLVEDGTVIRSGGEGEAYARRVENLLKRLARDVLVERTEHHLRTLGQRPVRVSIADTRSRWGSCSPQNRTIRYSWRVVMAPPPVIDYLAAHEVGHLVHADHSPAYWAVVERLIGDHRPLRRWLRDHGAALHAVGR